MWRTIELSSYCFTIRMVLLVFRFLTDRLDKHKDNYKDAQVPVMWEVRLTYHKTPKNLDTRKIPCDHPKI